MLAPQGPRKSDYQQAENGSRALQGCVRFGTKRHCRDDLLLVRFQPKAHIAGRAIYSVQVEIDPKRTQRGLKSRSAAVFWRPDGRLAGCLARSVSQITHWGSEIALACRALSFF